MSVKIQWLGHSAFLFDVDGHSVLIDPFLTGNPLAAAQAADMKPEVILLSHAHGDHIGDTVDIAKANNAKVITNFEIGNYMTAQGVEDVVGMNPGGKGDFGFMTVKFTRAYHSSSFPDGAYGGVPCGFVITAKESGTKIYFAGDTALFSDMQLIGNAGIDMAILPIGDFFTMGVDDSVMAVKWIDPSFVVPMHYNTFPPIVQNAADWAEKVNTQTESTPVVLDPGGEYTLE
jgi:L-ascorbate metabolism protein UlaG (beta-lactamase superfamily)